MKTKSLGEILSDAAEAFYSAPPTWRVLLPRSRERLQKTAELFLDACGATPGALAPAIERMVRAAVAARTVEVTSPTVASKAAKALRSKRTGKAGKSIAASALTQTRNR